MSNNTEDKDGNKVLSEISKLHSFWLECGLNGSYHSSQPKGSKLYQIETSFDPSDLIDQKSIRYNKSTELCCNKNCDVSTSSEFEESVKKNVEDAVQSGAGDQRQKAVCCESSEKLSTDVEPVKGSNSADAGDCSVPLTSDQQDRNKQRGQSKVHQACLTPDNLENNASFSIQLLKKDIDQYSPILTASKESIAFKIEESPTKESDGNLKEKFRRFNKPYSIKPIKEPRLGKSPDFDVPFDYTPTSSFSYHAELDINAEPDTESMSSFAFRLKSPTKELRSPSPKWTPRVKTREEARAMCLDDSIKLPSPTRKSDRWNSESVSYISKSNEMVCGATDEEKKYQQLLAPNLQSPDKTKRPLKFVSRPSFEYEEPYYMKRRRVIKGIKNADDDNYGISTRRSNEQIIQHSPPKIHRKETMKQKSTSPLSSPTVIENTQGDVIKSHKDNSLRDQLYQSFTSLFTQCGRNVHKVLTSPNAAPLVIPRTEASCLGDNFYSLQLVSPVIATSSKPKRPKGKISSCPPRAHDGAAQKRSSRHKIYRQPSCELSNPNSYKQIDETPSFDFIFRNDVSHSLPSRHRDLHSLGQGERNYRPYPTMSRMSQASADSNISMLSYLNHGNIYSRGTSPGNNMTPTRRRRSHDPSKRTHSYRINL